MNQQFDIELSLENTLSIYLQGPEVWNKYVEDYDNIYFNFRNVPWGKYQQLLDLLNQKLGTPNNVVSFKGYKFKSGIIDFTDTDFGLRQLDFSNAQLNYTSLLLENTVFHCDSLILSNLKIASGRLSLAGARIGHPQRNIQINAEKIEILEGDLICRDVVFSSGDKNFSELNIHQGDVDFSGTVFRDGNFSLSRAQINGGSIEFQGSKFGTGNKFFVQSKFAVSQVIFSLVDFGSGNLDFHGCDFSKVTEIVNFRYSKASGYSTLFSMSTFAEISIDFSYTIFDCKLIDFSELDLANGNFIFESCEFSGRVTFSDRAKQRSQAENLSFRKSIFNSTLDVSWISTKGVIDFRETKLSTHTTLDNLKPNLYRNKIARFLPGVLEAARKEDASKLRRLKEIAESNKNYAAALRFHADEMRARRWHDMPKLASILDAAFSFTSNYGQSILRPILGWLIIVLAFGAIYSSLLVCKSSVLTKLSDSFLYSVIQTLPVFPISRTLQHELYESLSNLISPSWLLFGLTIFQNLLGVIFLFLIGLGLRNRFRL